MKLLLDARTAMGKAVLLCVYSRSCIYYTADFTPWHS